MINNECNKGSNVFNSIKTKKDTINLELNIVNVTKGGNVLDRIADTLARRIFTKK